jgi:hypothetical protein
MTRDHDFWPQRVFTMRSFKVAAVVLLGTLTAAAHGQSPTPIPYDGIQAGLDAYELAEQGRRANLNQQLFLNNQLRYWNGFPTFTAPPYLDFSPSPRGAASIASQSAPVSPYSTPGWATAGLPAANLDAAYGYGYTRPFGFGRGGPQTVFEPWPYVPGDIYGYPLGYQAARQPIGRIEAQTGPNRWESHPVYEPTAAPVVTEAATMVPPAFAPAPPAFAPAPALAGGLTPGELPPPPPPSSRAREY